MFYWNKIDKGCDFLKSVEISSSREKLEEQNRYVFL